MVLEALAVGDELRDVLQVALMSGLLSDREEHAKGLRLAMQGAGLKRKDGEAAIAVELLARQPRPLTRNILLAAQPQASVASGLAPDSEAAAEARKGAVVSDLAVLVLSRTPRERRLDLDLVIPLAPLKRADGPVDCPQRGEARPRDEDGALRHVAATRRVGKGE